MSSFSQEDTLYVLGDIERLREHEVKRKTLENVTLRFHNWVLKRETGDLLGSLRSRNR